jgi:phage-related protein
LTGLKKNAVVDCPFEFWTDKETQANFKVSVPASIRSRLGGVAGSILDVYGGEYEFDNYTVKLHNNRGMNRGVSIRYGKNLTDIKQDQNCSNVSTGVYPYWVSPEDGTLVELPEKIVEAKGNYNFVKIRPLDMTQNFTEKPTVGKLRTAAEKYVKNNDIGVPSVSLTVSFAQLEQTDEYKGLKLLERVSLFDTVNVEFPALNVSASAKAVKVIYDVILDRVKSVTLGAVRANIADTITQQQQELNQVPTKTFLEIAIESLTKSILGANGGSVRMLDTDGDGEPDTLYIADHPDLKKAVKVWRFNYEGWGASKNGYNGPFTLGASFDSGLLADFMTAGTLNASLVNVINLTADSIKSKTLEGILLKAGQIISSDEKISIDLSSGKQPVFNTGIKTNGLTIRNEANPNKTLFDVNAVTSYGTTHFNMIGNTINGTQIFSLSELFKFGGVADGVEMRVNNQDNSAGIALTLIESRPRLVFLSEGSAVASLSANSDGLRLQMPGISNALKLYWEPNYDGSYTLMGKP